MLDPDRSDMHFVLPPHSGLLSRGTFPKLAAPPSEEAQQDERARHGTLFYSVAAGDAAAVRALLQRERENKVDLDEIDDGFSNSPLHWAAATGSTATCRALLDGGIGVERRGDKGHTALHIAAMHGCFSVVELLVARGANLDEANDGGITPRHLLNIFCESSASVDAASPAASRSCI